MTYEELDNWFKNLDSMRKRAIALLAVAFRLSYMKDEEDKENK